jgi:hypothetical protein
MQARMMRRVTAPVELVLATGMTVLAGGALKTPASTSCTWDVAAGTTLPDGSVTARIMFVGGKPAYDGLKTNADFVPVAGLENSLHQAKTGALLVLDGANLVTVQGLFSEGLPPKFLDVQEHLVALAKLATKRV